jgi:hypothetical protein
MITMSTQTLRPARRLAMVLAAAGIAGLGTLATASSAAAAPKAEPVPVEQDGSAYVVKGNGNGPNYFIVVDDKKIPVFFCDEDNPNKRHNICIANPETGPRF